jgi:DNA-binding NtrC family response regulator
VIPLKLPTLSERREDIPALVEHFAARRGHPLPFDLSEERFTALLNHEWPGNVRELENVVERMIALPDIPVRELFDQPLRRSSELDPVSTGFGGDGFPSYQAYMQGCEDRLLRQALARAEGNISAAAKLLDLPRSTLRSKLEKRD